MTILSEPALLDVVRAAAVLVLDVPLDELQRDTRWVDDLEADSLAMIEILEVTEERLRAEGMVVRVDDGTLASLKTLNGLVIALRTEAEV